MVVLQFVGLFSLISFPKKVNNLVFIKCLTFEFQKNDPPFQLKLPPKAARPEKEVDPEYEEKMVSAFMTKHPAAFYGTWLQDQHSYKELLQPGCVRKQKQTKITFTFI